MPSVFSHIAVPLAIGLGLGKKRVSRPLLVAGLFASVFPDLDVLGAQFGIAFASEWGHRGFSHSIVFAILCGLLALLFSRQLQAGKLSAFLFISICTLSHPLLDALSNGGLGVALYWPFDNTRHFFQWRPIEVAHIGLRFFLEDTYSVLKTEIIWVWCPAIFIGIILQLFNRNRKNLHDVDSSSKPE